jgi:hypothetical protein
VHNHARLRGHPERLTISQATSFSACITLSVSHAEEAYDRYRGVISQGQVAQLAYGKNRSIILEGRTWVAELGCAESKSHMTCRAAKILSGSERETAE